LNSVSRNHLETCELSRACKVLVERH
jgi:hypothetical protein